MNDADEGFPKYDEDPLVEYGAISVGVMTLGLILLVEVLRHKIDHEAQGRPFFQAVLEGVYSELATLGIVEFMLYVLNSYYKDLDQKKYKVFADVHFALFYTAILNAFQSVLLAFVSNRVAHRIWVKTEMLEVNHYVEIREEFERVKQEVWFTGSAASTDASKDIIKTVDTKRNTSWLNYPILRRYRYNQLLLQIRFHELRMHFIDAYKLPIRLKLSDYLLKSQERVLLKLVHVSSMAWLLLTGAVNLLYYVTGIISYEAQESLVGVTLNIIFLICMTTFAGVAAVVYLKMKSVFRAIMGEAKLWDVHNADQEERDRLAVKQLELFWGNDPKYVIALLQFMQFGYAVMVSVAIIFWEEVSTSDYSVIVYLALVGFCYAIFVMVTAQVIPQYTMCTSLAQLINEETLDEIVCNYRLDEAKQKSEEPSELLEDDDDDDDDSISLLEETDYTTQSESRGGSLMRRVSSILSSDSQSSPSQFSGAHTSDKAHLMAQLVKLDTQSLRTLLPSNESTNAEKRIERANRVARRKTRSEGVAAMTAGGSSFFRSSGSTQKVSMDDSFMRQSSSDLGPVEEHEVSRLDTRNSGRRKSKSDGVTGMFLDMWENEQLEPISIQVKRKQVRMQIEEDDGSTGVHSDVDDIPEVDLIVNENGSIHSHQQFSVLPFLRNYFLSKKYVLVSNVFGTMIAFFFIGKRVERFLHTEGILDGKKYVSFDFKQSHSFWPLMFMMCAFLVTDVTILFVLGFHALTRKEKKVTFAAALDLVLVSTCLAMFIVAEISRCCESETYNLNATDLFESNDETTCSCAAFGNRLYGGLGSIEPYVSLLALRVFRRVPASYLAKLTETGQESTAVEQSEFATNPFDVFGESTRPGHTQPRSHQPHDHSHTSHHGHEKSNESVSKLWMATVSKHPELVEKHGQFSGEILKAMLGIHAEQDLPTKKGSAVTYSVSREFSGLSSEAQSIILAGKLGRSVKQLIAEENSKDSAPAEKESDKPRVQRIKFKICEEETLSDHVVAFKAPNARLVRSMRRCDRKVLPILNQWTEVDVVITKYEMVYFDAHDNISNNGLLEALKATKGGKGLRLKDVAVGRRVVGHLEFSEIESIFVQRYFPGHHLDCENDRLRGIVSQVEFWSAAHLHHGETWNTIKQDQMRIKTVDGRELVLRFFSDLEDARHHPEHLDLDMEESGPIHKNNTFQWVQTIGRYCGPAQLKQKLPHFGDQTDEELRDYLVVAKDENRHHGHRGDVRNLLVGAFSHSSRPLSNNGDPSPIRRAYGRPSSFDENTGDSIVPPMPKPGRLSQRSKSETQKDTTAADINTRLEL